MAVAHPLCSAMRLCRTSTTPTGTRGGLLASVSIHSRYCISVRHLSSHGGSSSSSAPSSTEGRAKLQRSAARRKATLGGAGRPPDHTGPFDDEENGTGRSNQPPTVAELLAAPDKLLPLLEQKFRSEDPRWIKNFKIVNFLKKFHTRSTSFSATSADRSLTGKPKQRGETLQEQQQALDLHAQWAPFRKSERGKTLFERWQENFDKKLSEVDKAGPKGRDVSTRAQSNIGTKKWQHGVSTRK